jgi:hypothetical protein
MYTYTSGPGEGKIIKYCCAALLHPFSCKKIAARTYYVGFSPVEFVCILDMYFDWEVSDSRPYTQATDGPRWGHHQWITYRPYRQNDLQPHNPVSRAFVCECDAGNATNVFGIVSLMMNLVCRTWQEMNGHCFLVGAKTSLSCSKGSHQYPHGRQCGRVGKEGHNYTG